MFIIKNCIPKKIENEESGKFISFYSYPFINDQHEEKLNSIRKMLSSWIDQIKDLKND